MQAFSPVSGKTGPDVEPFPSVPLGQMQILLVALALSSQPRSISSFLSCCFPPLVQSFSPFLMLISHLSTKYFINSKSEMNFLAAIIISLDSH